MGNIQGRTFGIVRWSVVDMGISTTILIQILNAFGSQEIYKGKGAMWFITRLIKAVKVLLFIQQLEFFLHLGKPIDASISVTKYLLSSHEVVKPDCFEDVTVNWCEEIGLL